MNADIAFMAAICLLHMSVLKALLMYESWERSFIICLPSSTFLALEGKSNIINNQSLFFLTCHICKVIFISPQYVENQEGSI